jgi:hypothetical protein
MANSYLQRTLSSGNRKKFTVSAWVKRSKLGAQQLIINTQDDGSNQAGLQFLSGDTLNFYSAVGGTYYQLVTNRVFRDSHAWYHIVGHYDTTDSTQGDRIKLYVNGVRETSFSTATYPTQDYDTFWNQNKVHTIGAYNGASLFFEGYLSHVAFVDNAALTPTSFGETESTSGIWKFKAPSGITFGTNGFHLKFENSGALGTDSSGNSNTFTVNGNLKQSLDTPSNVHAVMNPLAFQGASNIALTNGNLTATNSSSTHRSVFSTLAVSKGKWYFETKIEQVGASYPTLGIYNADGHVTAADYFTVNANGYGYNSNGDIYHNNSAAVSGQATWTTGDIIGVALDVDNDKVYFHKNGTYINSGNPSSGSNGQSITADSTWYFAAHLKDGGTDPVQNYNFGDGFFGTTAIASAGSNGNGSLFEYDVPTGFYALNTKNINTYG